MNRRALVLFLAALLTTGCSTRLEEEPDAETSADASTPIATADAGGSSSSGNYLRMKVDGLDWEADPARLEYLPASNHRIQGFAGEVRVSIDVPTASGPGSYEIGQISDGKAYAKYLTPTIFASTSGTVEFQELTDGRARGTFSFKATENGGSRTADITAGEFSIEATSSR